MNICRGEKVLVSEGENYPRGELSMGGKFSEINFRGGILHGGIC